MNERIRELAEQAEIKPYMKILTGESDSNGNLLSVPDWSSLDPHIIKFAELIVRECIAQASISNGHGNNQWDKALTFAAKNIKEHFGVEE